MPTWCQGSRATTSAINVASPIWATATACAPIADTVNRDRAKPRQQPATRSEGAAV